jgi:hypothetical protein
VDVSKIQQVTATGDVTTTTTYLQCVVLTGGSDAATLTVRAGGSSGTTVLTVKAAAATTVPVPELEGAMCSGGVHATLTGTAPAATFVYT